MFRGEKVALFAALAAGVLLWQAAHTSARAKPNFTGAWQLNVERSRLGDLENVRSAVFQIEHRDPQFRMMAEPADIAVRIGGPKTIAMYAGSAVGVRMQWENETLLFSVAQPNGRTREVRYTLWHNGKVLTATEYEKGKVTRVWVFDRPTRGLKPGPQDRFVLSPKLLNPARTLAAG